MGNDKDETREKQQTECCAAHDTHSRVYIFFADGMNIGGIETLLVRMANQISGLGYRVIVVAQDGPCMQSLDNSVVAVKTEHGQSTLSQLKLLPLDDLAGTRKVFFWAATPYTLVSIYKYQRYLYRRKNIESVSISGIFGPARSIRGLRHLYAMIEHLLVLGWLPDNSIYFMSKAVQSTYVEQFGDYFAKWPIHKLTLDQSRLNWQPQKRDVLKVVSIGRITKLKPYNFGALQVVESMTKKGIPIQWDIWGHGEEAELLQDAIRDRGLSSQVIFHGELPYSQFNQVVLGADLFVGMGTAALEAAQKGVPTVVALAWSSLGTYGFLYQCPADSIGEHCTGTEEANLTDVISSYTGYSNEERVEIGLRCREAVLRKTSGDPPPFDTLFEGGINYPNNFTVSLRMKTFGVAQNVWDTVKRLVNVGKTTSRSVRGDG